MLKEQAIELAKGEFKTMQIDSENIRIAILHDPMGNEFDGPEHDYAYGVESALPYLFQYATILAWVYSDGTVEHLAEPLPVDAEAYDAVNLR